MSNFLPNNEHAIERLLRVVLGVFLLSLVVLGPKTYWGLLGIVPLANQVGIAGHLLVGAPVVAAGRRQRDDGAKAETRKAKQSCVHCRTVWLGRPPVAPFWPSLPQRGVG